MNHSAPPEIASGESSLSLTSLSSFLLASALGTLAAVILLPAWMPNLAHSLIGTDIKAYWYLSRGSAFVALCLLWLSMVLGLLITNRISKFWPGAPAAFAIHEYVSLLGLAFASFHALILIGDHYINYQLAQILIPFASINYHPFWVGLGQLGLYVWAMVAGSFYVRPQIGSRTWRLIHYASFFMFVTALFHGVTSGSDTSHAWAQQLYWGLGASFVFLVVLRIVAGISAQLFPAATRPVDRV